MFEITGKQVMASGAGHNYHLFRSCYGNKLGQGYHVSVGNDIYRTHRVSVETAIEQGYFACRVCYKRAGLTVPAAADRVKVRDAKRAERLARKAEIEAAKAENVAARAATDAAVDVIKAANVEVDVNALIASLIDMLKLETLATTV
jgi:hypothetical protein